MMGRGRLRRPPQSAVSFRRLADERVITSDPIAQAWFQLGGRWTLSIIFALMDEPASFGRLRSRVAGISANILSSRLARLIDDGLVVRNEQSSNMRALYALTGRGAELSGLRHELDRWSARIPPTASMAEK